MNIGMTNKNGQLWNIEVKQSRLNTQEEMGVFLHLVEIAYLQYGMLTVFTYN